MSFFQKKTAGTAKMLTKNRLVYSAIRYKIEKMNVQEQVIERRVVDQLNN